MVENVLLHYAIHHLLPTHVMKVHSDYVRNKIKVYIEVRRLVNKLYINS